MQKSEREMTHAGAGQGESRPDAWSALRQFTRARIAPGRAGGSWRTETLLEFRLAHARARDAVGKTFEPELVEVPLQRNGYETLRLTTAATSRPQYLLRPDLGRTLSETARRSLAQEAGSWSNRDLSLIVSDGLSALAAETHAAATLTALLPRLIEAGWTMCPIFVVPLGRVKLQDEIGAMLKVRHTLMLIGERPGLGAPDSLGAYFTYQPGPGRTDADRNCVSNIRLEGLPPHEAGARLAELLAHSAANGLSGVRLGEPPDKSLLLGKINPD